MPFAAANGQKKPLVRRSHRPFSCRICEGEITGKRSTSPVEFKPSELPVMKMAKNYTHRQSPSPGTFTAGIDLLPGSALVLAAIDCVTVFDPGLPGIIIYRSNLSKRKK